MAVSPDLLYAALLSYKRMRDERGFPTNMRVLRALMEHGPADATVWMSERFTNYACDPGGWNFTPQGSQGSCWINPRGLIFSICYGGHERFAYLVTGRYDTGILERAGWIHVSDCRIDIEYTPTPLQAKTVEKLQDCGYRVSDCSYAGKRISEDDIALIPPALHNLGELTTYDWEDPRYWEGRGIPRNAHRLSAPHEDHTDKWCNFMYEAVYNQPREYWTPERIAIVAQHSRTIGDGYIPYRLEMMERGDL